MNVYSYGKLYFLGYSQGHFQEFIQEGLTCFLSLGGLSTHWGLKNPWKPLILLAYSSPPHEYASGFSQNFILLGRGFLNIYPLFLTAQLFIACEK